MTKTNKPKPPSAVDRLAKLHSDIQQKKANSQPKMLKLKSDHAKKRLATQRKRDARESYRNKQRQITERKRILTEVAHDLDLDHQPEPNDKFNKGLWGCDTIDAVHELFEAWWAKYRKKASAALERKKVSPDSQRIFNALLHEAGATSMPVLTSQAICEKAFQTLRDRLVQIMKVNPEYEVCMATFIDGGGETSHTKTEVELFLSQKRVATTCRAMSDHFFGVTELALFNSHGHPDGGQRVQRHEHVLVVGPDVHRKAAEVAAKHAKRFSPNFTGARAIDIKKVATDEVNLTRVAAYLFKPPYQCSNWCEAKEAKDGKESKKGFMNHSEKGDRNTRYMRLMQLRSMFSIEDITFAGGDGQRIRSDMIKLLRVLAATDAAGGKQVLHPDAISTFWVDFVQEIGAATWNLPIIKKTK